jgi:VWFA-related protein
VIAMSNKKTNKKTSKKLPAVLTLATLLTLPLMAQAPAKEVIDVQVTNVEIIATDAKGNHVPGLTRDDFELYENGKLQPITNLFEATTGAAPDEAAVPRRLVLYFDDSTILPNNRKQLIPALKKFVAAAMTPQDQVMIVTFNQTSKVRLPWTNDAAAVQSAIDAIGREAGGGSLRQAARNRVESEIQTVVRADQATSLAEARTVSGSGPGADFRSLVSNVRNYATSVNHDFAVSAAALESLLGSLAPVDGRKIVLIASESFTTRPGGELFAYLENVRNDILSGNGSEGLKRDARSANITSAAAEFNTNETVLALGRVANASGVTIYAIDPDIGGSSGSGNVQQTGSTPQGGTEGTSGVDGLQILARATGGLAWIGMKPAMALEKLSADLDNYYSLGYRATNSDPAQRAVEVKSKRPGVRVRTMHSAVQTAASEMPARGTNAPTAATATSATPATPAPMTPAVQAPASEMDAKVTSNLQTPQKNELGISAEVAGDIVTDGDKRRVPVHVLIPASKIKVVPEGEVFTGGFSVYVCTAGGETQPSAVNEQSHEIRWTPAIIEQLDDRKMTFAIEVILETGRDLISIGVLDHRSQTKGFSRLEL